MHNERDVNAQLKEIIFVINSSFPHYSGGRETWLYNIATRLDKLGIRVSIVSLRDPERAIHFTDMPDSIRIMQCPSLITIPLIRRCVRGYARVCNMLIEAISMRRQLRRWVGDRSLGVICIAMDTVVCPLSVRWLSTGSRSAPYVVSVRGPHAEVLASRFPMLRSLFRHLERRAVAEASMVWANGHDTQDWLQEMGIPSVLVPNGLDTEAARCEGVAPSEAVFHRDAFRIISVGTLLDIKGVRELLAARARLEEAGEANIDILFLGKGNSAPYRALAERLGIEKHVFFLGERRAVMPYIKASHTAVCLSGGSGMSMSALECLGAGVPVVAWNTPVYRQLIREGITGSLVTYGDTDELAAALRTVQAEYVHFREMARNAAAEVEQYDWSNIVRRVMELAAALIQEAA